MKAIVLDVILSGFRSRKDKSLGFSASTPELTTVEKVALMDLDGLNLRALLEPRDYSTDGKVEVKGLLEQKPPSQRLRAVLFVQWKQQVKDRSFEQFYLETINALIDSIKATLEPE